jgi:hypothetical protein
MLSSSVIFEPFLAIILTYFAQITAYGKKMHPDLSKVNF